MMWSLLHLTMYLQLFILIVATSAKKVQLSDSLNAVLDFGITNKIEDLNFLIGVAIAKAQLNVIEKDVTDEEDLEVLHSLQRKCAFLLLLDNSGNQLISPSVWTLSSPLRQLTAAPPPDSAKTAKPMDNGVSDMCLEMLLSECSVSLRCLWAELCDYTMSYQITHQIMYWTAYIQKCNNNTFAQTLIEYKCSQTLQEHQLIRAWGVPGIRADIYWEQMVLCGIHGFLPFFHDQDMLLSLQTTLGCFAFKRANDCNIHFSGVATAALSIFFKLELSQKYNKISSNYDFHDAE